MAIRRKPVQPEEQYTIVSNEWARDGRITLKARGLLTLVLSHRVGWNVTIESLAKTNPEGRAAIRTAVEELEKFGYLKREMTRDDGGSFAGYDYVLTDPPSSDFRTGVFDFRTGVSDFPTSDNPSSDNPTSDNRTPKKNNSKKTISKKTITKAADAEPDGFSDFWSSYPASQKGSKKAAQDKYQLALRTMSSSDLMARLEHYKKAREREERSGEFVPRAPHVTTWLNQERWNDFGEFDPELPTTGPESLTPDDVVAVLGPDNWSPKEPDVWPENWDWGRYQQWVKDERAKHFAERQQKAWEKMNGKAG